MSDAPLATADSRSVVYRSLAGKVVVLTGGASGIGASMVAAFAAQGSVVHFLDVDEAGGCALAGSLSGVTFHFCDLRQIAELRATLAAIESACGGIDVLVNNAANDDRHDMFDVEPEYWRDRLAVNLDHQFFATQAVARGMQKQGGGSIIMMSSTAWMKGLPGLAAYTASKAAIVGLTRSLARELGRSGIRVNCILPGAILTERQATLWRNSEIDAEIMRVQALKRQLDASDVARMALFLASAESSGCTGAQFLVDAGFT